MPQLDIFTFRSQVFVLIFLLAIGYMVLAVYILPNLLAALKLRRFYTNSLLIASTVSYSERLRIDAQVVAELNQVIQLVSILLIGLRKANLAQYSEAQNLLITTIPNVSNDIK